MTNLASATSRHSFLRRQHISDMHAKEKICDFKQTYVSTFKSEKYYYSENNISDDSTLEHELSPLKAIKDSYPKILLANTRHDSYDIEGIRVIDIAQWLLETN